MHIAENYWFYWHRSDVGTMLPVFLAKCEEPRICKTENISNAKGFLWRTTKKYALIENKTVYLMWYIYYKKK